MITQAVFQDHILDQILAFNEYGITSSYSKNGVEYFVNQFWTSKQRQGNSLHEISYRACFKSDLNGSLAWELSQHYYMML